MSPVGTTTQAAFNATEQVVEAARALEQARQRRVPIAPITE